MPVRNILSIWSSNISDEQIKCIKQRLSILYFLQFAVWGSYLTSFGQFLGAGGLGANIAWFYAAIGIVSLFTPTFMGYLADRYIKPANLLSICHIIAGTLMFGAWIYAQKHPQLNFGVFYTFYLLFLAFYMPTMALANTTSFGIIKRAGHLPVDIFPSIRVWGTVGFICAMWLVNSTYYYDGHLGWTLSESHSFASYRFQYNSLQLFCAGVFCILTGLFSLSLPTHSDYSEKFNIKSNSSIIFNFKIFRNFFFMKKDDEKSHFSLRPVGIFLIFAALIGVCMQISNGFATPFISHFLGMPEYAYSFAAGNATMLFSLSQISEALLILLVGRSLKKYGIKVVFAIGILAWSLRFLFFGIGNPHGGFLFLVLSMVVYGIAFNFITIAGHLHMESVSSEENKGVGQGLMMLMSNGIGATIGVLCAGSVINHWCHWETINSNGSGIMRLFMGDWIIPWLIFSAFALIILIIWLLFYKTTVK